MKNRKKVLGGTIQIHGFGLVTGLTAANEIRKGGQVYLVNKGEIKSFKRSKKVLIGYAIENIAKGKTGKIQIS